MSTLNFKKKFELFNIINVFTIYINNEKYKTIFFNKSIELPNGLLFNVKIKYGPLESNSINIDTSNKIKQIINIKKSPTGKYGSIMSFVCILSGLIYFYLNYVQKSEFAIYFIVPLFIYFYLFILPSLKKMQ